MLRVLFVSRIPILVTFERAKTLPTAKSLAPLEVSGHKQRGGNKFTSVFVGVTAVGRVDQAICATPQKCGWYGLADFSELEVCERVSDKDVLFKMKTRRGDHYPTVSKTPLRLLLQIGGHLIINMGSSMLLLMLLLLVVLLLDVMQITYSSSFSLITILRPPCLQWSCVLLQRTN